MNNLIAGFGEVGQAVSEVVKGYHHVSKYDTAIKHNVSTPRNISVLHICFPPSPTFVDDVRDYMIKYDPVITIIWSSVPIGTTRSLGPGVVHSPVEGVHPNLALSIRTMDRWIGCNTESDIEFVKTYFEDMNIATKIVSSSDYTEFLKLRSTSKYAVNIIWTGYEKYVADQLGMDFEYVKEFDKSYNRLYEALEMPQYQRYILDPPEGPIGGHCLVSNAEILYEQYPSDLLEKIREYGK